MMDCADCGPCDVPGSTPAGRAIRGTAPAVRRRHPLMVLERLCARMHVDDRCTCGALLADDVCAPPASCEERATAACRRRAAGRAAVQQARPQPCRPHRAEITPPHPHTLLTLALSVATVSPSHPHPRIPIPPSSIGRRARTPPSWRAWRACRCRAYRMSGGGVPWVVDEFAGWYKPLGRRLSCASCSGTSCPKDLVGYWPLWAQFGPDELAYRCARGRPTRDNHPEDYLAHSTVALPC